MKNLTRVLSCSIVRGIFLAIIPAIAVAGEGSNEIIPSPESSAESRDPFRLSAEYEVEETYIGEAKVSSGRHVVDDLDESDTLVRFVLTPRIGIGVLRLGASYERFSFGSNDGWPVPDSLQAANLVVGLDTQFSDSILLRIEAQPGFYSAGTDDLNEDDFGLPFVIGGTYIYSPNLQFVLGLGVDANRKYPILPGGGIRWKLARQWVLNAVMPTPRLEYQANPRFTLYGGATLKNQTFRTGGSFGSAGGKPELNHAVITYAEVRTGLGFDWTIAPALTLTAEFGYLPYREFDFFRTDLRYHQDAGAPYGTILLHGAF